MALTGMVLGFTSLFIDQYDLHFSPEGIAKDVADVTRNFQQAVQPVTTTLKTVSFGLISIKYEHHVDIYRQSLVKSTY